MPVWEAAPDGYLDAIAGQPMEPAVAAAWQRVASDAWPDPTALHYRGRRAGLLLDAARSSIAASVSACSEGPQVRPDQVWLAGSADAARLAVLRSFPGPLITSTVDARAVLDAARSRTGSQVIDVDALGRVSSTACADALERTPGATLCVQFANPEIGSIHPIDIPGVQWLADASQCLARIHLPAQWTALWAGARDWGGPVGVGIAVVRGIPGWHPSEPVIRGWVGGIPDVPAAVAAATALERAVPAYEQESVRAFGLIERIRQEVAVRVPDVEVLGDPDHRLPHVVTFSALYVSGEALVSELDRLGFAVASGSSCAAEEQQPSHVLAAVGAYTGGNVRISLPFGCTEATVNSFLDALPGVVQGLRQGT